MPNHCYNKIRIDYYGEEIGKIQSIKNAIFNKVNEDGKDVEFIDFKKIIPPPPDMFEGNLGEKERQMCKEKGIANWYDWQIENWGTKWTSWDNEIIQIDSDSFVFEFTTAWNEPQPIFNKIIELCKGCVVRFISVCEGGFVAKYKIVDEKGAVEDKELKELHEILLFAYKSR